MENISLTKSSNEIKRLLNCLPGLDKKRNDLFREYLSGISMNPRNDRQYSMLSEPELREFMSKYEEGNRRIAEEYLKGQDKLFDDSYQVEKKWESGNSLLWPFSAFRYADTKLSHFCPYVNTRLSFTCLYITAPSFSNS